VPWRSASGWKFDNARDGLLHGMVLAFEVLSQDLGQLRPFLGIRLCARTIPNRRSYSSKTKQPEAIAANDFHIIFLRGEVAPMFCLQCTKIKQVVVA
jgi:hypothetical protein